MAFASRIILAWCRDVFWKGNTALLFVPCIIPHLTSKDMPQTNHLGQYMAAMNESPCQHHLQIQDPAGRHTSLQGTSDGVSELTAWLLHLEDTLVHLEQECHKLDSSQLPQILTPSRVQTNKHYPCAFICWSQKAKETYSTTSFPDSLTMTSCFWLVF